MAVIIERFIAFSKLIKSYEIFHMIHAAYMPFLMRIL